MKETYTRTMFISNEELQIADIIITEYNADKYTTPCFDGEVIKYTGLTAWDILTGDDAIAYENECGMGDEEKDPHNEYLVLHFNDGSQATFCNSKCDMRIR